MPLPEDDPVALSNLLHWVRANFSKVPRRLDFSSVYGLLVLMDRYDTLRLIRPWKDEWLNEVISTRRRGNALRGGIHRTANGG